MTTPQEEPRASRTRSKSASDESGKATEDGAKKAAPRRTRASGSSAGRTRSSGAGQNSSGSGQKAKKRTKPAEGGALARGAERASGERSRRSGTPLLSPVEPVELSAARREAALRREVAAEEAPRAEEPVRASTEGEGPERTRRRPSRAEVAARRRPKGPTRLRAVAEPEVPPTPPTTPPGPGPAALEAGEFSTDVHQGPAEMVALAVNVLRAAAAASGISAEEVEKQVAETLRYLRRRLSGDYRVDEFGFDEDYTLHVHLPLLRPLYKKWFRVEVLGVENIPSQGGALVVANHSGTVAMDSLMAQVAVHDEHPAHRHLRMLGADLVFNTPFVGTMARRSGSTLADNTDAERLLAGGHVVGVWPEGFKGVGKPFSERYKLQRFGRGGFVAAALRAGVPIIPCSIVGAEEIYPIIGNMPTVARLLGLPYAPITPTFPLLGPLGLLPLPSKWLMEFGAPIDTAKLGPEAADDPMLVFDLTDQVRETIQQTLYRLLMMRSSVFL